MSTPLKIAYFTVQSKMWVVPNLNPIFTTYLGSATDLYEIYKELKNNKDKVHFNLIVLAGHKSNIRNDLFMRKIVREFGIPIVRTRPNIIDLLPIVMGQWPNNWPTILTDNQKMSMG